MKDQLEDFVHRNRGAFDDKEPSPDIWKSIGATLGLNHKSWLDSLTLWRAAAIIFMTLCGYLLIPKESAMGNNALALKEFTDVESFYIQQISQKVELIDEFKRSEGLNGFTHDFEQLEAMYMVLKEEMKSRPGQKVKDALVLNLLVRIDLLNQHLQKLEDEFKPEKEGKVKEVRKS